MNKLPQSIMPMIAQKPFFVSMNGMPLTVFMPNIAAKRVRGKTITEKIVRVFIIFEIKPDGFRVPMDLSGQFPRFAAGKEFGGVFSENINDALMVLQGLASVYNAKP